MSMPAGRFADAAWQRQQQAASEWVWQLPEDTALIALTPQLAAWAKTPPLRPILLRLHHRQKQPQQTIPAELAPAYASTAPGLNTLYVSQHVRLSVYIGPHPPTWPAVPATAACWPAPLPAPDACPPWFAVPPSQPPQHVAIIGAGIAGASTAYALARLGVQVSVWDQGEVAGAASGNRQGLVYAKISPHMTAQSQLLLAGYGFTLRLLQQLLPERQGWHDCGVLHLDVTAQEQKRNQALANWPYPELFHPLNQATASALAGLPLPCGGLFWPQGGWVNPPSLIAKLLDHPNISVHPHCRIDHIAHEHGLWQLSTAVGGPARHQASHIVLCQGHLAQQFLDLAALPLTPIRGQVNHHPQPQGQPALNIALSGHSYVSPPWQNQYCLGASFQAGVTDTELSAAEAADNLAALAALCPPLAHGLSGGSVLAGKAAIRCDSHDHLPLVGAIGPRPQLRAAYAALGIDKTHPIDTPCTWHPNLYINTAHGSRGLATAPLCGFALAHELLGQSSTLGEPLRQALHPHRFWIRQLIRRQP